MVVVCPAPSPSTLRNLTFSLVKCNHIIDGKKCAFFQWKQGSTQLPTASPILPSTPALPNTPVLATTPLAPPATVGEAPEQNLYPVVSHNSADVCPAVGCNQMCIHVACPCHLCQKHCVTAGGCALKSHTTTGQPPVLQPALVATTGLSSEDSANNSIATSSQVPREVPVISSLGGPPTSLTAPAMQSNPATVDP